jgi:uncharacterized protein YbbK (DUF523 family)
VYIISACLVGVNCKYNGENNDNDQVHSFIDGRDHILVCPEEIAGISTPRPPAEIIDGRVYNKLGQDVTADFERGAIETYRLAMEKATALGQPIEGAILKAKSPSCGCGRIYDGSFSGIVIPGDGKTAAYLKKQGIKVITEEDL